MFIKYTPSKLVLVAAGPEVVSRADENLHLFTYI